MILEYDIKVITMEKCHCNSFRKIIFVDGKMIERKSYILKREQPCPHKWVDCSVKEFHETLGENHG